MKKILVIIIASILLLHANAQLITVPIGNNTYQYERDTTLTNTAYLHILDSINANIVNNVNDTAEGGARQNYSRHRNFIENRLPSKNHGSGMLSHYPNALENARIKGKSMCAKSYDGFNGNWECIGPKDKAELHQNQGVVNDIWVDPTDDQFIYLATEGGGLWKTSNGGVDWVNITDNIEGFGTMGISKIAVNPFDRNEIYFTTIIYNHFYNPNLYSLGIWHTADGGVMWNRESLPQSVDITKSEILLASGLKFAPYKVNNKSFLIMTTFGHVFSKVGNNPWVLYTPNWGGIKCQFTSTWPFSVNFEDIEFAPDIPGTFFISNQWGLDAYNNIEMYQIKFDITNGNLEPSTTTSPNPKLIMDATTIKAMNSNTGWNGTASAQLLNIQIEYLTNGNFAVLYKLSDIGGLKNRIFFWDIINPTVQSKVIDDIPTPNNKNHLQIQFEIDPLNNDVMYVGTTLAYMIYKINNTWSYKQLSDYGENGNYYPMHSDNRKLFIGKSTATASIPIPNNLKPGYLDVVYWGNDGGIASTTKHDYTKNGINNISTIDNLNGNGLYIADMYDVDFDGKGEIFTSAQYHGGYKITNKISGIVNGGINGDGLNARVDARFPNSKNIIVRGNEHLDLLYYTPASNNISYAPSTTFTQPENNGAYRYSPMQFREEFMDLGIKNVWESLSSITNTGYGNDIFDNSNPPNKIGTEWKNYFETPNYSDQDFIITRNASNICVQFKVAPSDPTIAYNLFAGNGKNFLFTKGHYFVGTPNKWKWEVDRTPGVVSSSTKSFPATDFDIDPNNSNRLFMAISGVNTGIAGLDRVITSLDGGITWASMSAGLSELPVNCLLYQAGSDDIIYAGTDNGVYSWNKPTMCWVKMNKGMPSCLVTRLRIDYCRGKLMAATYGRGIWESDLINLNPTNISLPGISNTITTNTTWNKKQNH